MRLPVNSFPLSRWGDRGGSSATFIVCDDRAYSFAQVNRLASGVCALLQGRCQPGDKIAILMPNGLPFVLSILALMRLRAISVPLNTRLTDSELRYQPDNAACKFVISVSETRQLATECAADALELPPVDLLPTVPPAANSNLGALDPDADFAIIHTSGTTGRPKAAILTLGNIHHSAIASAARLGVEANDRWLCVLPLYHVGGLSIVLRSLIYGTAFQLMRFDVAAVNRALSEQPITLVSLAPTMLRRLLDAKTRAWNPRLRLVLLGGEHAPPALIERALADGVPVAASYGLSEASSQVATAMPDTLRRKSGTVGKPLHGMAVRIVDDKGADCPPDTPGEALVKGASVMRGYHGDTAATATALREGWLHTGDIGCMDTDGDLFILQRRGDLIVSGGENVYPAEVEAALRLHPSVADALVFGMADERWGQRVAVLIQLAAGETMTAEDMQAFARRHLAGYKIPRAIAFADLPRTASGKVLRSAAHDTFMASCSS